jgi:hypothetical protein
MLAGWVVGILINPNINIELGKFLYKSHKSRYARLSKMRYDFSMTLLTFNLESIYPIQIAMTTNTERT